MAIIVTLMQIVQTPVVVLSVHVTQGGLVMAKYVQVCTVS